jgi:hypothetical protein
MPGYFLRFGLLPLAALVFIGSCWDREGYYRYSDAGPSGIAGTTGSAGTTGPGAAGTMGTGGSTGGSAAGTAGTITTGRGGTTGSAGRGGTTGSAGTTGRGGTTGTAGVTGTAGGSGNVLFMDDFETGMDGWNSASIGTSMLTADGSQVFSIAETAGDQYVWAAGSLNWTNQSVEARVKVLSFTGTSSSDVAAICARLTDANHFYYFAIQSDGKGKIKIQNNGNSSIGSSIDFGYSTTAPPTWYTMRLTLVGSSLTGSIFSASGTMLATMTVSDSNLTMGAVGLMVQRTSAEFDDVVVRTAP